MKPIFFSAIAAMLFAACQSCKSPMEPQPQQSGKLKIIWRTPYKTTDLAGSNQPVPYGDKVIFTNYTGFEPEPVYALDAATGKQEAWRWMDYMGTATSFAGYHPPLTDGSTLFVTPANGLIAVDMKTGNTLWKNRFSSLINAFKFETTMIMAGRQLDSQTALIKLIDIKTGADRLVFSRPCPETPYYDFSEPCMIREANGDTILYFSFHRAFQQPDLSILGDSQFYAYDLTKDSILYTKDGLSNGGPPLIIRDKMYINADDLMCLNRHTADTIWIVPKGASDVQYMCPAEGKLLCCRNSDNTFRAFNMETGALEWQFPVPLGSDISYPAYMKGLVYYRNAADGLLWAIRVSDGKTIWSEKCPDVADDPDSYWSFGVGVDSVRNRVYVGSFRAAFCLEGAQ